jgi:hypothetical protein
MFMDLICDNWESNPGQLLGRQLCYHYTITAKSDRGDKHLGNTTHTRHGSKKKIRKSQNIIIRENNPSVSY